jgi:hypothetical protein
MGKKQPAQWQWIVVRLGDDLNWWLDQTSDEIQQTRETRGVLDPRQVAHLVQELDEYRAHGLHQKQIADAFQIYTLESEIAEGSLRLAPTDETLLTAGPDMFALPNITGDDEGPYHAFLDAVSAARIRRLNATHRYTEPCTEFEMQEELDAIDSDRYFGNESIHTFDEINEMLEWSPAEWDASDSEA